MIYTDSPIIKIRLRSIVGSYHGLRQSVRIANNSNQTRRQGGNLQYLELVPKQ